MPSHVHDAIIAFSRFIFRQLDAPTQVTFTREEVNRISLVTTNTPLPGITRLKNATTNSTSTRRRTKQAAYQKMPDFALNYDNRTFPQVVFEVGWATEQKHEQKYKEGLEDARDWLVASGGKVKIVWLIQAIEGQVLGSNRETVEALLQDDVMSLDPAAEWGTDRDSSNPPSRSARTPHDDDNLHNSEENSAEDMNAEGGTDAEYVSEAESFSLGDDEEETTDKSSSAATSTVSEYESIHQSISSELNKWIGPLSVFIEGYTYNATDKAVNLTYPRAYLLRSDIPSNPLPTLPLSRAHFHLHDRPEVPEVHLRLDEYVDLLQNGRVRDAYVRKTTTRRVNRENKRRSVGNDPDDPDWVADNKNTHTGEGAEDEGTAMQLRTKRVRLQ